MNMSLKEYNTLGMDIQVNDIIKISKISDIKKIFFFLKKKKYFYILGGGSNIFFLNDFDGVILLNKIKGIKINFDLDFFYLHVYSGEKWNDLVKFSLYNGIWGLENLAFIPGTVGGGVVNNIGAYGLEISDFVYYVEFYDFYNDKYIIFDRKKCGFKYRFSVFKNIFYNNRFIILKVVLKIFNKWSPCLLYKEINVYYNNNYFIKSYDIYNYIKGLRMNKIPDYKIYGNLGSFFKNPILNNYDFDVFYEKYFIHKIFFIKLNTLKTKIFAWWLILNCNLKKIIMGGARLYKNNVNILINYKNATPCDVYKLYKFIKSRIFLNFNILIETEVIFIDFNSIIKRNIFRLLD